MARLRIRIELSRGGLGVPLHKMASVIAESQKFFHMLAEDVRIDKSKGEWLGFDFDNESLNFTAEYVGPVTADQVRAFHAAFDGTTSLRRGTIVQFARITEAIGEEELIGFGLYQSDDGAEPTEWRCLSRRDALRITDGIQLLSGANEELDQESHLPTVRDPGLGARMFGDRRERVVEHEKWVDYVREVETELTGRLGRVESNVEQQSVLIQRLNTQSASTEESFRNLLSAVENFCKQATHQVERIAPAPQIPAPSVAVTSVATPSVPEPSALAPSILTSSEEPPRRRWFSTTPGVMVLGGALGVIVVFGAFWLWPAPSTTAPSQASSVNAPAPSDTNPSATTPASSSGISSGIAPSGAASTNTVLSNSASSSPAADSLTTRPVVAKVASPALGSPTASDGSSGPTMRIELEATEPTWISMADSNGTPLLAQLLVPGQPRRVEVNKAAKLRTGNAGGLDVSVDGKPVGPLGPHGKIREIEFKDGEYKLTTPVQ